jgi:plastocyanin
MKQRISRALWRRGLMFIAALCLAVQGLWATTHVVQFGGNQGFVYSPSTFAAVVGDTVKWEGDFSVHPLSSTSIPAAAQAWHNGSGSSFIYVIQVAGTYHYQCDVHFSIGMIGSFTATASAVRENPPLAGASRAKDIQLAVTVLSGMPYVTLIIPKTELLTVKVFDLSGRELTTVADQIFLAGAYSIPLGKGALRAGYYFVRLSSNGVQHVVSFFISN